MAQLPFRRPQWEAVKGFGFGLLRGALTGAVLGALAGVITVAAFPVVASALPFLSGAGFIAEAGMATVATAFALSSGAMTGLINAFQGARDAYSRTVDYNRSIMFAMERGMVHSQGINATTPVVETGIAVGGTEPTVVSATQSGKKIKEIVDKGPQSNHQEGLAKRMLDEAHQSKAIH
ncbi:MAG: hypothetical protein CMM94_06100 [Rickettsiales bacterium]|nr:hypothetical protein [Rickettsiales bacterium]